MNAKITNGFWRERLDVNAHQAIFHQWDQLEASGCIENFRIAAAGVDGLRAGYYFADSDAYKWLDAASRIYASIPDPQLASVMDELILLLTRAHPTVKGHRGKVAITRGPLVTASKVWIIQILTFSIYK